MFRLSTAVIVLLFVSPGFGAEELLAKLETARGQFRQTEADAARTLETAFGEAVKDVAATGDLDAVRKLLADQAAFEDDAVLPESTAMQPAVKNYEDTLDVARKTLLAHYQQTIVELTKALKIDEATAVQNEMKTFEQTGALPAAPGTPAVSPMPGSHDPVRQQADAARERFQQTLRQCQADLSAQIAGRLVEANSAGDTELVAALMAVQQELANTGSVKSAPEATTRAAVREYDAAVRVAERNLTKEYQSAIAVAVREKNLELARLLTVELDGGFTTDGPKWVVLFRSDKPEIWNTQCNSEDGWALPVASAPDDTRFLRMRRMDNKNAVYLPISKENLAKMSAAGDWGWNGSADLNWQGRHLGIYKVSSMVKFPAPNTLRGVVSVANKGFDTYFGYGFGHFIKVDQGQGYSWAGRNIRPAIIEISVTTRDLSASEAELLLK